MLLKSSHIVIATVVVFIALLVQNADAALSLTVSDFTTDHITVSISGTFEDDVSGDRAEWLALKPDWSNNDGVNVNWISDSVGFDFVSDTILGIDHNTISFSNLSVISFVVAASGQTWGDSLYFKTSEDVVSGTTVSGTVSLTGTGLFDPTHVSTFQLVSGFDSLDKSWNRLEATYSIPEPTSTLLIGVGGMLIVVVNCRSRTRRG